MSSLEEMQAGLRDLIKNRQSRGTGNAYLKTVANSRGLVLIREIAVWWRALQLETYCVFTAKLLKKLGIFEETVQGFFFENPVSPYIETASDLFLSQLSNDGNALVAAMAQFERAVARVKQGDLREYCVTWDRNPEEVLNSLRSGVALPEKEQETKYEMRISHAIRGTVSCVRFACEAVALSQLSNSYRARHPMRKKSMSN